MLKDTTSTNYKAMKGILFITLVFLSIFAVGCTDVPKQNSTNNTSIDSSNSGVNKNKVQDKNAAVKDSTNNANTVSEQQTTKVQEQQVSYKQYGNARFGFNIEYPSDFTVKLVPDNGDGLIFQSADKKTELTFSGINNVLNHTAVSEYNDLLSQHSNASYKKQVDNWLVVSWVEGNNIVYEKRIVGGGSINGFIIKYPISQKDYYNTIVSHLVVTFETPEIDTSH